MLFRAINWLFDPALLLADDGPIRFDRASRSGPPYGASKMSVARDARAARKRKAKRRARKLGHA